MDNAEDIWRRKIEYLEKALESEADVTRRIDLEYSINEAREKLTELTGQAPVGEDRPFEKKSALDLWGEKLALLEGALEHQADPKNRFSIEFQIEEAKRHIGELSRKRDEFRALVSPAPVAASHPPISPRRPSVAPLPPVEPSPRVDSYSSEIRVLGSLGIKNAHDPIPNLKNFFKCLEEFNLDPTSSKISYINVLRRDPPSKSLNGVIDKLEGINAITTDPESRFALNQILTVLKSFRDTLG